MKARTLALLGVAATAALVLTTVAMAAFGAPETADPERWTGANDAIHPDMQLVADGAGNAYWISTTGDGNADGRVALYRRCGAPGAWPRVKTFGGAGKDAVPTAIEVTPDGYALMTWYVDDGSSRTFYSLDANGSTFGPPQAIVTTEQTTLYVALGDNGDAVAAWPEAGKVRASIRPKGGSWSAPETFDDDPAQSARVAMDADGDAVLLTYASGQERAYYRPAGGAWGNAETVEDLGFLVLPQSQEVEFDGAGRPVALYSQQGHLHASIRSNGAWQQTPTPLDDTNNIGVAPLARHPNGLVAVWLRRLSDSNSNLQLAVARLNGSTWENEKVYSGMDHWFGTATVSADTNGQILVAAARFSGQSGSVREVWGTTLASISAPFPADLERLTPATGAPDFREPDSAAGGGRFFVGYAVHGTPDDHSDVIATGAANACPGDAQPDPSPDPNPSPQPQPPPPDDDDEELPALSKFLKLPSAAHCAKKKKLKLKVKEPPAGFEVDKINVLVDGKKAKTRRKGDTIRLKRMPKDEFKLKAVVKLEDGRKVKGSRKYTPC